MGCGPHWRGSVGAHRLSPLSSFMFLHRRWCGRGVPDCGTVHSGKPSTSPCSRGSPGSGLRSCALCDKRVSSLQESSGCPLCRGPPRRLPACSECIRFWFRGCCLLPQEAGTAEGERGPCAREPLVAPLPPEGTRSWRCGLPLGDWVEEPSPVAGFMLVLLIPAGGERAPALTLKQAGVRASAASCGEDAVPACPMWRLCRRPS